MTRKSNVAITLTAVAAIVLATAFLYPTATTGAGFTKLTWLKTGGIAGVSDELVIESDGSTTYSSDHFGDEVECRKLIKTACLDLDEKELAELLRKVDSLSIEGAYNAKSGVADHFSYTLTTQVGSDRKTYRWVDDWASEESLPRELVETQLHLESIVERARQTIGGSEEPQERAISLATKFIEQAPTFNFDGIPETLELVEALTMESFPEQHIITIRFDSRHAGYGDRADQLLAQVITAHTAEVKVVRDNVVSAVLDERWDELNQEVLVQQE